MEAKIIDFHTHTFPAFLAGRAIAKLAGNARALNYLNGTAEELRESMRKAGVDYSLLLPVVTRPDQQEEINRIAGEVNARTRETGLISFGGIHPDNEDYRGILRRIAEAGIRGIKLHPVFQKVYMDDVRYLRIVECAWENGLIVLTHAGYDIGYPGLAYSSVSHIASALDVLERSCAGRMGDFVLAHMGGWDSWKEVEERIVGREVFLDTSFSLLPIQPAPGMVRSPEENPPLSREAFLRMVRGHGADRILFGTDSPWSGQEEYILAIKESGLTAGEQAAILGGNAAKLLNL